MCDDLFGHSMSLILLERIVSDDVSASIDDWRMERRGYKQGENSL